LAGHAVHAVIHPDAAVRPALQARGATWHPLPNLGEWDPLAILRARRLLRELRPDVCIAHGNRAVTLLRAAGAWPLIGVLPNYKMHCRGLAAAFHSTLDLRRYALGQGMPPEHLYHIPNMVRVPPVPPLRVPHTPPVIGSMGRFVPKKGFDVFIAALALLARDGVAFRAVLGGEGDTAAALHRLATAGGMDGRIAFPGWIENKPGFFAGLDVFCLPSQHEPFGIVLLEAMAQAVPVVSTASEGPSEIVRGGTGALLVPIGDAAAMAEALLALLTDPARAAALADSGYRLVRDSYDLPRIAERLDAAVRAVVARAVAQGVHGAA
jgi:glycosyltransferase involved in cell wall biosynthesis